MHFELFADCHGEDAALRSSLLLSPACSWPMRIGHLSPWPIIALPSPTAEHSLTSPLSLPLPTSPLLALTKDETKNDCAEPGQQRGSDSLHHRRLSSAFSHASTVTSESSSARSLTSPSNALLASPPAASASPLALRSVSATLKQLRVKIPEPMHTVCAHASRAPCERQLADGGQSGEVQPSECSGSGTARTRARARKTGVVVSAAASAVRRGSQRLRRLERARTRAADSANRFDAGAASPSASVPSSPASSLPSSSSASQAHSAGSGSGSAKKHACHWLGCAKSFDKPSALKRHIRSHTGERPFACPWPACSQRFSERGNLKRHQRIHTGEKPYRCDFSDCTDAFARRSHLLQHIRAKHDGSIQTRIETSPNGQHATAHITGFNGYVKVMAVTPRRKRGADHSAASKARGSRRIGRTGKRRRTNKVDADADPDVEEQPITSLDVHPSSSSWLSEPSEYTSSDSDSDSGEHQSFHRRQVAAQPSALFPPPPPLPPPPSPPSASVDEFVDDGWRPVPSASTAAAPVAGIPLFASASSDWSDTLMLEEPFARSQTHGAALEDGYSHSHYFDTDPWGAMALGRAVSVPSPFDHGGLSSHYMGEDTRMNPMQMQMPQQFQLPMLWGAKE